MPSTMQDIARECGLSMMTVSRVLRGQGYVSAAARDKVLKTAKHLDYELNTLAQNFARKRSGVIGVAAPFAGLIGSHYFGEIFQGFQRVFDDNDRHFALFDTLSTSFNEGGKLEKLYRTRKVEGLLVVAPSANDKFLDTFTDLRIPLVVVGKTVTNPKICCVGCEDYQGIESACAHLFALGHRKIGFVGGPTIFSVAHRREQAYLDFCKKKKLAVSDGFLQRGDYSMRSGREAGAALLGLKSRPTAILAANDMMAFGLMESARERGVAIPDEVSIAGYDDLPTAADRFPSLTTVHQPVVEMAERSARLLLDWLETGRAPGGQITLPTSLVERASTARCVSSQ